MYVIPHYQLTWAKKLLYLLMVAFCITYLSACDSSTSQNQPTNSSTSVDSSNSSDSSKESTDDKQEKPGVVRCAP